MAGPNNTNISRPDDLVLGRGKLFIASLNADGSPGAYTFAGNVPEASITVESETLEHTSSISGLGVIDKEVVISQSVNLTFTLDEINFYNETIFLSGEEGTHTNAAVAGFTQYLMVTAAELASGKMYEIRDSSDNRAYDVNAADVAVETNAGTPVDLVQGTDYSVDTDMGTIQLISTSTVVSTAVANGDGLMVTLTAKAGAGNVGEARALTVTNKTVAIKFVQENPADNGSKVEVQMHKVNLKGDGDHPLISDEFATLGFTGKLESNTTYSPNSPFYTKRVVIPQ